MGSVIREFRDYPDRNAHTVDGNEVGNIFRVLKDGSLWKSSASGSGEDKWTGLDESQFTLTFDLTLASAGQRYAAAPRDGKVVAIYSIIDAALTTGDEDLTAKIGGSAVTGGAITITQSGSAAGDVDSATPSAANTFSEGDALEVETDGANGTAANCQVVWVCEPYGS